MFRKPMRIQLPDSAQSRVRELYLAHLQAKAALALYLDGIMAGLGLDPNAQWDLDTDSMTLLMAAPAPVREVSLAPES